LESNITNNIPIFVFPTSLPEHSTVFTLCRQIMVTLQALPRSTQALEKPVF